MKKNFQLILACSLTWIISSGVVHAACNIYTPYNEYYFPPSQVYAIAYASGSVADCRTACRDWGHAYSVTMPSYRFQSYYFAWYPSHPSWFPGNTTMRCEVTNLYQWGGQGQYCPQHADGGQSACNY